MKLNETLKSMYGLFTKYAPAGAALIDFKQKGSEYIVLYRDDKEQYVRSRLNSSGFYDSRYYANYLASLFDCK